MELLKILSAVINEARVTTISQEYIERFQKYIGRAEDMKSALKGIKLGVLDSQSPEDIKKSEGNVRKLQQNIVKNFIDEIVVKLEIAAPKNIKYNTNENINLKYKREPTATGFGEGPITAVTGEVFVSTPNKKGGSIDGVVAITLNFPKTKPPNIIVDSSKTYLKYTTKEGDQYSIWGTPPGGKDAPPKYSKGVKDVDTDYIKGTEKQRIAGRDSSYGSAKYVPIKVDRGDRASRSAKDMFKGRVPSFTKMAKSAIKAPKKVSDKIEKQMADFANSFDWDTKVFKSYQTQTTNVKDRVSSILNAVVNTAANNKLITDEDAEKDDDPITKTKGEKYTKYVATRGPVTVKIALDNNTNVLILNNPKPEVLIKGARANK